MSFASIIVATPYPQDLTRWQEVLSGVAELRIVAHAPGLMELFNKVEHTPPNMVIISNELCQTDDFELIVTLFRALDVRWTTYEGLVEQPVRKQASGRISPDTGLFPVSLKDNVATLVARITSIVQAKQRAERPAPLTHRGPARRYRRMVLIGSSTGGVDALKTVLKHFGPDCPPTVIVQHTSLGFGEGLVKVLGRSCAARVQSFVPDQPMKSGGIYVVAGQVKHAVFASSNRPQLRHCEDPPMSGHRPSIDKLFLSAVPYAPRVIAAVLTGMGRDGAQGLLELRNAGANTLCQDKESSVVYGMPGAAWSMGAAMTQVSLADIGPKLLAGAAV